METKTKMMIAGGVLALIVTIIIIVVVVNNNKGEAKAKAEDPKEKDPKKKDPKEKDPKKKDPKKKAPVKSKEGVFKTNKALTLSNREPDYYYTDGEYEIRGHIGHRMIGKSDSKYNINAQAKNPTFKLDDREKILLEKFKSTNVKFVYMREDLVAAQVYNIWTSETNKGIYPEAGDNTFIGYVINKVKYE